MFPIVGLSEKTRGEGKKKRMIENKIDIHLKCVGTRHSENC
jgi:hypothetical protein